MEKKTLVFDATTDDIEVFAITVAALQARLVKFTIERESGVFIIYIK